jgi:antitoxin CcdA
VRPDDLKKAANVRIRGALLDAAREDGIKRSATLEAAPTEGLRQARQLKWLAENREAIAAYTEYVGHHGVFSDGLRRF